MSTDVEMPERKLSMRKITVVICMYIHMYICTYLCTYGTMLFWRSSKCRPSNCRNSNCMHPKVGITNCPNLSWPNLSWPNPMQCYFAITLNLLWVLLWGLGSQEGAWKFYIFANFVDISIVGNSMYNTRTVYQGCQMVCFQTKNPKFG
jgi:hypothetical protein